MDKTFLEVGKKKNSFFSEYILFQSDALDSRAMLWNIQNVKCMHELWNMCNKMMEEKADVTKQYFGIGLKNNVHVWGVEGFCDFEFFCPSGTCHRMAADPNRPNQSSNRSRSEA